MTVITTDEWIAELERLSHSLSGEPTALTVTEMMDRTGLSNRRIRDTLKQLIRAGRWECVWEYRSMIDGWPRKIPAYRPVRHQEAPDARA
jgi:hypothetical protein